MARSICDEMIKIKYNKYEAKHNIKINKQISIENKYKS